MDLVIVILLIGLFIFAISKIFSRLEEGLLSKVKSACRLHKWHPHDSEGWLPDNFMEDPRLKKSKLMCMTCLREPNSQTDTIMEEE